jgi:ATP-dependent DNA ligase
VKYDGYRLRLERDGDRVGLITRGGYNWTDRYPWIVEAARKVRQRRFVLDGEAVVLGVDGVSDFNALHSREPSQCRPLDQRVRASHRQSNSCIRAGPAAPDKPRSRAR